MIKIISPVLIPSSLTMLAVSFLIHPVHCEEAPKLKPAIKIKEKHTKQKDLTFSAEKIQPRRLSDFKPDLKDDILAIPKDKPDLKGTISNKKISGKAFVLPNNQLKLTVINHSKLSLVVDVDQAKILSPGLKRLSRDQVIPAPSSHHILSDSKYFAYSFGTLGAGPNVTDEYERRTRKTGMPGFYGVDRKRRALSRHIFSRRTLLPGEESTGKIYLNEPVNSKFVKIIIPISEYPSGRKMGTLTVPVVNANAR